MKRTLVAAMPGLAAAPQGAAAEIANIRAGE
jgi:hypothetical protein